MSGKLAIVLAAAVLLVACGREAAPQQTQPQPRGAQRCAALAETTGGEGTGSEGTKVPTIEYGTSVDEAMAQLERAGLCGHSPDVNFPHYVIGTKPAAGSMVDRGTRVALLIGDG